MNKLISVVVPVYNVEGYLHKCIDSILSQGYENMEIIVVNDGSTDNSGRICDEYAKRDERIKVIHKANGGPSDARNIGIKSTTGEYLMFVDSDDWIEDDCIGDIVKIIKNNPVDIILGHFKCHPEPNANIINDISLEADKINGKARNDVLKYLQSEKDFIFCATRYVINRSFLVNNNLFFYKGIFHEDEEWGPRLLCASNSFYLYEKPFYCYRTRTKGSTMSKRNFKGDYLYLVAAVSLYEHSLNDKYNNIQKLFFYKRAEFVLSLSMRNFYLFDPEEMRQIAELISNTPLLRSLISKSKAKVCLLVNIFGLDKGIKMHRFLFNLKQKYWKTWLL